jgi:hypothetical protein
MKQVLMIAAMVVLGAALTSASAGDNAPGQKAPTKTMGDEGKLPATKTTEGAVPDMTGPNEGTNPVQDDGSKRMGDEGKLPATGAGSNAVPDMTAPSK